MTDKKDRTPHARPDARPLGDGRELLRTGTYLHTSCPHCNQDLLKDEWIHLTIITKGGEGGELKLSPRFNIFDKISSIELKEGASLDDLLCPACEHSLIVPDLRCELCGSKIARVRISTVRLKLDLYVCTKIGCYWHGIPQRDQQAIELDTRPDE